MSEPLAWEELHVRQRNSTAMPPPLTSAPSSPSTSFEASALLTSRSSYQRPLRNSKRSWRALHKICQFKDFLGRGFHTKILPFRCLFRRKVLLRGNILRSRDFLCWSHLCLVFTCASPSIWKNLTNTVVTCKEKLTSACWFIFSQLDKNYDAQLIWV